MGLFRYTFTNIPLFYMIYFFSTIVSFCFVTGCHVVSAVESGLPSTVSVISIWCWSLMLPEQATLWEWVWRGRGRDGWAWAETGGRTGNQTHNWSDRLCRLGLQAVTDEPPPHGTSPLPNGSSDRHSPERTLGFEEGCSFPILPLRGVANDKARVILGLLVVFVGWVGAVGWGGCKRQCSPQLRTTME